MRSGGGWNSEWHPPPPQKKGKYNYNTQFFGIDQKMAKGREWSMGQFTPARPFPIGKKCPVWDFSFIKNLKFNKIGKGPLSTEGTSAFLLFTAAPKPKAKKKKNVEFPLTLPPKKLG